MTPLLLILIYRDYTYQLMSVLWTLIYLLFAAAHVSNIEVFQLRYSVSCPLVHFSFPFNNKLSKYKIYISKNYKRVYDLFRTPLEIIQFR